TSFTDSVQRHSRFSNAILAGLISAALLGAAMIGAGAAQRPAPSPNAPARPAANAPATYAEKAPFFDSKVKPILTASCFACHGGGGDPQGNLRLTSRAGVLKGGASGPAVNLSKPGESLLLKAVNHQGRQMPPGGK